MNTLLVWFSRHYGLCIFSLASFSSDVCERDVSIEQCGYSWRNTSAIVAWTETVFLSHFMCYVGSMFLMRRFYIHILYYHYKLIWPSLLHIVPPDFLTGHSIVRLFYIYICHNIQSCFPCISIRCRTANIASAIPLPGIKPSGASPSLLSIIISQIIKVYQLYPSAIPTILDVSLLFINWYTQTISPLHWHILLLVYTLHHIDNMSTPSSPKHIHTSSGIPSISVVSPFFIRGHVTLQYLIPADSLC